MCKRAPADQLPPARSGKRLKASLQTNAPLSPSSTLALNDRITTVQNYIDQWDAELKFIYELTRGDNPFAPDFVVRTATTAVQDKRDSLAGQLQEFLDEREREKNRAAINIVASGTGAQAGDGNLYIQFVNIGLGDCTLITTPLGARIMVDCGCDGATQDIVLNSSLKGTGAFTHVRNQVKNDLFLHGRNEIDLLLLTHTDKDHHNKIESILTPLLGMKVHITYYGGTENFTEYGKSASYLRKVCGDNNTFLKKAIIREEKNSKTAFTQSINDAPVTATAGTPKTLGKEFIDANKALVLYYEVDVVGKKSDFKISLLAANATGAWKGNTFYTADADLKTAGEKKINGSPQNQRSLLVLVECFGQKILICGDGTVVTEYVAMNHYKDTLLSKVDYQRIGHHGSPTSSSKAFVASLKQDKIAVASVGGESLVKHHLPQKAILNTYLPLPVIITPAPASHTIYAWEELTRENLSGITNNIWATGSNDSYQVSISPP